MQLRISGILATLVFLIVALSDLLMLTTLDFSRPYRFWMDAANLPHEQVMWGYFLGILTGPFFCVGAWHMCLALRPAPQWVGRLALLTTAYSTSLLMVFHASFAFTRSILRAQGGSPGGEALMAFESLADPIFRIAVWVAAPAWTAVLVFILLGRSLYPRWAGLVLPGLAAVFAFPPFAYLPASATAVLGAAHWNFGGAAVFALSTVILWNHDPSKKLDPSNFCPGTRT
jgi:hypothetical protein